jgi:hypothetical protein
MVLQATCVPRVEGVSQVGGFGQPGEHPLRRSTSIWTMWLLTGGTVSSVPNRPMVNRYTGTADCG